LMLGFIVVSGILSKRILMGLKPEVTFAGPVFASSPTACVIAITNSKRLIPSLGIRMAIENPGFPPVEKYFFYLPPGLEMKGSTLVEFPRRGIHRIREVNLQTRLPFCFFIKTRRYQNQDSVKVYPSIVRLSDEFISQVTEGLQLDSPYRGDSHQLLHLRDYLPFDSSKHIHWKASARAEKWLVREFQREQGRELHIYFDVYPARPDERGSEIFEHAISLVASFAAMFSERGIHGSIHFPDREFVVSEAGQSIVPLLDYLALIDTQDHPGSYEASESETPVLQIRSREIPPASTRSLPPGLVLYVEDFERWLQRPRGRRGERK